MVGGIVKTRLLIGGGILGNGCFPVDALTDAVADAFDDAFADGVTDVYADVYADAVADVYGFVPISACLLHSWVWGSTVL
jgi:hypothetical protein